MDLEPRFAVVVPTSFRERGRSVRQRLREIVESGCFAGHPLIVSHGSFGHRQDRRFRAWLDQQRQQGKLDYRWTELRGPEVPLGFLRNRGANAATSSWLLFFDVDLATFEGFPRELQRCIETTRSRGFAIVPCLYATAEGTRRLSSGCLFHRQPAESAFFGHRRDLITHVALNTSTVLVSRRVFWEVGGFDARYQDHGLEDFDFLIRLAIAQTDHPIPSDLLVDTPNHSPAFSVGFRSYLNLFSLPSFLDGLCTLHRWHPRPLHHSYYHRRAMNLHLFTENVMAAVERSRPRAPAPPGSRFLRSDGTYDCIALVTALCQQRELKLKAVSALYDDAPQYLFQRYPTWRRFCKVVRHWFGVGERKGAAAPPPTQNALT